MALRPCKETPDRSLNEIMVSNDFKITQYLKN